MSGFCIAGGIKKTWENLGKALIPTLIKIDATKLTQDQLQLFDWLQKTPMPHQLVAWQGICMIELASLLPEQNWLRLNKDLLTKMKYSGLETLWYSVSIVANKEEYEFLKFISIWKEEGFFRPFIKSITDENLLLSTFFSKYFKKNYNPALILATMRMGVLKGYNSCFSITEPEIAMMELERFLKTDKDAEKLGLNRLLLRKKTQTATKINKKKYQLKNNFSI